MIAVVDVGATDGCPLRAIRFDAASLGEFLKRAAAAGWYVVSIHRDGVWWLRNAPTPP